MAKAAVLLIDHEQGALRILRGRGKAQQDLLSEDRRTRRMINVSQKPRQCPKRIHARCRRVGLQRGRGYHGCGPGYVMSFSTRRWRQIVRMIPRMISIQGKGIVSKGFGVSRRGCDGRAVRMCASVAMGGLTTASLKVRDRVKPREKIDREGAYPPASFRPVGTSDEHLRCNGGAL